jgi:hypothetical protein
MVRRPPVITRRGRRTSSRRHDRIALSASASPDGEPDRADDDPPASPRPLVRTCDGCDNDIARFAPAAQNQIYVHTVDPYRSPDPTPPIVPRTGGSQYPPSI